MGRKSLHVCNETPTNQRISLNGDLIKRPWEAHREFADGSYRREMFVKFMS